MSLSCNVKDTQPHFSGAYIRTNQIQTNDVIEETSSKVIKSIKQIINIDKLQVIIQRTS